jgi:hypothetical protein
MCGKADVKEDAEPVCVVEFMKGSSSFYARVQSEMGGVHDYRSSSFEEVLEQVVIDLQEEFESTSSSREEIKEDTESICIVEFLKGTNSFVAKVQSDLGGGREYRSTSFDEVLEQVVIDLQEEFESTA